MSETDAPPPPKKGMNCGMWVAVGVLLFLAVGFLIPSFGAVREGARRLQASNNCRQIIIALKTYAGEHNGKYTDTDPYDPFTSNEAFHPLIKLSLLDLAAFVECRQGGTTQGRTSLEGALPNHCRSQRWQRKYRAAHEHPRPPRSAYR